MASKIQRKGKLEIKFNKTEGMIERYDFEGQLLFRLNFKNQEFMFFVGF